VAWPDDLQTGGKPGIGETSAHAGGRMPCQIERISEGNQLYRAVGCQNSIRIWRAALDPLRDSQMLRSLLPRAYNTKTS